MTNNDIRPVSKSPRKFGLDRRDRKLGGVCAGLGKWMGIDPLIVRLVFVAGTLIGFGSFLLVYLAIWLLAD